MVEEKLKESYKIGRKSRIEGKRCSPLDDEYFCERVLVGNNTRYDIQNYCMEYRKGWKDGGQ